MKNSEVKTIAIIISGLIGLCIGILVNKLTNFPYFAVDKNVNIVHLLSILSPIAVGIYINIIINKKNEQDSSSKKIFTEKINEIENQIVSFVELIEQQKFNIFTIISKATRIKRGYLLLKDYNVLTSDECSESLESINTIKEKLTVSSSTVKIHKNIVEINDNNVSEVSDALDREKNKLFNKKLDIIRNK